MAAAAAPLHAAGGEAIMVLGAVGWKGNALVLQPLHVQLHSFPVNRYLGVLPGLYPAPELGDVRSRPL